MPKKKTQVPRLISVQEMADFLGVDRRTISRLVKKGLPSLKLGESKQATRLFDPKEVIAWLKSQYGKDS